MKSLAHYLSLLMIFSLTACGAQEPDSDAFEPNEPATLIEQHQQAFVHYLDLIEDAAQTLQSVSEHTDPGQAINELQNVIDQIVELGQHVDALEPLTNAQAQEALLKYKPQIQPVMEQMRQGMLQVASIEPLKQAFKPSMEQLSEAINSVNSPTVEQREATTQTLDTEPISLELNAVIEPHVMPEEKPAPSAFIVIQNARPANPQELVRQLQLVLPKTQLVKLAQSPNPQEIKLEVTNTKDHRALANKIPFATVESIDDRTRTITVDFDL